MRQGARAGKAGRGERPVCGASGFCSACWVWCARVQGVGPCSRFELRSTRYVQSQARRECSKSRSSTGARAPGTPHACAGNGWGRCGARARARTGESPPRSLVDGSCTALEASEGKTPWLLAARVGWAGARRTIAWDMAVMVGTRARCSVPSEAVCKGARLFSVSMAWSPGSHKRENRFSWAPLFFTKFHKNAFFKRSACSVTLCEYNRTRIIHTIHVKNLFKELVVIPFRRSM